MRDDDDLFKVMRDVADAIYKHPIPRLVIWIVETGLLDGACGLLLYLAGGPRNRVRFVRRGGWRRVLSSLSYEKANSCAD